MAVKDKGKGKGKGKGKAVQARKTPSLKQKLHRESKVVRVDNLKWKKVDIPDTLDDFEGFYGLEEIDGVDVEIVDGVTKFVVKDDSKIANGEEDEEEKEEEDENDVEDIQDEDEDMEDAEFVGFDDAEPEKTAKKTKKQDKKSNLTSISNEKKSIQKEDASKSKSDDSKSKDDELTAELFSAASQSLTDKLQTIDTDLPEWKDIPLSSYTLSGLASLGFTTPTGIQKETISLALSDSRDVIGKASTGSGKTLAYGIPILEKYLQNMAKFEKLRLQKVMPPPTGIIFAPTRELAHQVVNHLNEISQFSPLAQHGIVSVTGGLSIQKQERLLLHGPGIIVATPGRFLEICQKSDEMVQRLALTDFIVLDEADRLLQDGHFDEFEKILELFHKNRPKQDGKPWKWQTLVFSATFAKDLFYKLDKNPKKNKEDTPQTKEEANQEIVKLLHSKLRFKDSKPAYIDCNPNDKVSNQISEALVECGATERDLFLYYFLLMYPGSTLVFANSIDSVKRLVPMLNILNIPSFSIHSSMVQKQRLRAIERFTEATANGKTAVLLASDVAARGLDIPNIDHVAHYHLPRSADVYIHRSGRTARGEGKEGVSVMFCSPQESSGPLRKLRKAIADSKKNGGKFKVNSHQNVKLLPVDLDIVSQLRQRIHLASKLADNEISNTLTRKEDAWVSQAAEDLGIDDLDDIGDFDDDILKRMRKRKENKQLEKNEQASMKYELKQLLSEKLRKNARRSYITSGLENLAHQMVSGNMHDEVLGHSKINALDDIRKKPQVKVLKPKAKKQSKKKEDVKGGKVAKPQAGKQEGEKKVNNKNEKKEKNDKNGKNEKTEKNGKNAKKEKK